MQCRQWRCRHAVLPIISCSVLRRYGAHEVFSTGFRNDVKRDPALTPLQFDEPLVHQTVYNRLQIE
jgi:hypothetical protein